MAWPPAGFSLRWFGEALDNPTILAGVRHLDPGGAGAVAIALVLGTLAAMAVQRYSFFGRESDQLPARPADRAAGRAHRDRAELDLPDGRRRASGC